MDICCRICRRKELKDCFSLDHRSDFYSATVLDMMQALTGLEGALGDHLPQQICRICMGTLAAGYELRQLCIESYAYFHTTTVKIESQNPSTEETLLPGREIDGTEFESCLTFEQIKLESFVGDEEMAVDSAETNKSPDDREAGNTFICCFPNCSISYQFKELLIEHAASDHQQEKQANEAKNNGSEFYCIVCARTFKDELKLMKHLNRKKAKIFSCSECEYQTEVRTLFMEHNRAHSRKEKVCDCGYRTTVRYSFKRHQARCMPSLRSKKKIRKLHERNALQEHIADDRTNAEIVGMGFLMSHSPSMFYCCLSHCTTVCLTQQQLSDHFQAAHPEVRQRNLGVTQDSDDSSIVQCPICFLKFATKKALQIHLEDAYAPSFRCTTCQYICNTRKSAILHASIPCPAKTHRCSCGYTSKYQFSITRHMRDSGCPLEGSTVDGTFVDKLNNQNKEVKLHSQAQEPSANQVCSVESGLSCKYCSRKFPTREALVKHLAEEHLRSVRANADKKRHECPECLQRFTTPFSLNRHRKTIHKVVEENSGETVGNAKD